MQKGMATPPLPDPVNWNNLLKLVVEGIVGLIGFFLTIDQFFKFQKGRIQIKADLEKIEKEAEIKRIATETVTPIIAPLHDAMREMKAHREADSKFYRESLTKLLEKKA